MGIQEEIMGIQDDFKGMQGDFKGMQGANSPSKIEGVVAGGRGSMTGDGIIPPRPSGALPLSQGESFICHPNFICHPQLCDITNPLTARKDARPPNPLTL